jgi:putative ABC transport system permease protein
LAFVSLAVGWFAVTVLLAVFEALHQQARQLVHAFGADAFLLSRAEGGEEEDAAAWNRRQVAFFRLNLEGEAWVSGAAQVAGLPSEVGRILAVDENWFSTSGRRLRIGRPLDALDVRRGLKVAVAVDAADTRRPDGLTDGVMIGREWFHLVGWAESSASLLPLEARAWIPYTAGSWDAGPGRTAEQVDAIWFRARNGAEPEKLRRRVVGLLEQRPLPQAVWTTPESLLAGIRRWQRVIVWTAGMGGMLSVLLGAVSLASLLLTGVRERISEIGLRRALGATRADVAVLFVVEALVLTVAAALTGMLAAEAMLHVAGSRFPLPFAVGGVTRTFPLALACLLACCCALGPAVRAARLPPAEALRNE